MGNKINTFVTGALALVGLSANAQASLVRSPTEMTSIQDVSEKAPLYLEKFAQSSVKSDGNLVAWHGSHGSHGSHTSHQSGY